MANHSKDQQFRDLVFEYFKDTKHYNKINHVFNRIYNILKRENPDFIKMKLGTQWELVCTIYKITMHSKRGVMKDVSLFDRFKDEDIQDFDPEFGFVEPEYVEVKLASGEVKMIESL